MFAHPLRPIADSRPQVGAVMLLSPPGIPLLCFQLSVWRLLVERAGKDIIGGGAGSSEGPGEGRVEKSLLSS